MDEHTIIQGNVLRAWRKTVGISQQTLVKRLGLSAQSMVSRWEIGVERPGVANAVRLEILTDGEVQVIGWYPELLELPWLAATVGETA